jgi:hypothetical protein
MNKIKFLQNHWLNYFIFSNLSCLRNSISSSGKPKNTRSTVYIFYYLGHKKLISREISPIMSSVPDRKFYSVLKRIPVETVCEVLAFLTYKQWFALQFSSFRLARIIDKNINYLAYPKLRRIAFLSVRAKH